MRNAIKASCIITMLSIPSFSHAESGALNNQAGITPTSQDQAGETPGEASGKAAKPAVVSNAPIYRVDWTLYLPDGKASGEKNVKAWSAGSLYHFSNTRKYLAGVTVIQNKNGGRLVQKQLGQVKTGDLLQLTIQPQDGRNLHVTASFDRSRLAGSVNGFDVYKVDGFSVQMPNVDSRNNRDTTDVALDQWSTMKLGVGSVLTFRVRLVRGF